MADLLIVDDEPMVADGFARFLERSGHTVRRANTGESGVAAWRERRPDVTLLDLQLPDMSGFDVFARIREEHPVVIMISGHADIPLAVRAVQEGVEHFLTKPVELSHLGVAIERALEKVQLRQVSRYLTERRSIGGSLAIGTSPAMRELGAQVRVLAAGDHAPVLLLGESGTGKGRVAELIHAHSPRAHGAFVTVSCSGRSLRVDRTGALRPRRSGIGQRTARANRDRLGRHALPRRDRRSLAGVAAEAACASSSRGASAARAGARDIAVDVRIVAATARDLVSEVNAGRFREELYYRLGVMPLVLPPLRSRSRDDLAELIARLMDELAPQVPSAPRDGERRGAGGVAATRRGRETCANCGTCWSAG